MIIHLPRGQTDFERVFQQQQHTRQHIIPALNAHTTTRPCVSTRGNLFRLIKFSRPFFLIPMINYGRWNRSHPLTRGEASFKCLFLFVASCCVCAMVWSAKWNVIWYKGWLNKIVRSRSLCCLSGGVMLTATPVSPTAWVPVLGLKASQSASPHNMLHKDDRVNLKGPKD
jgi:hypothetical protein